MPALSGDTLDLLTDLAMRHSVLLQRLRVALEAGNDVRALEIAREICGMEEETNAAEKEWVRAPGRA